MRVRITAGKVTLQAELRETPTTRALLQALPFEAAAKQVVEPGTVCFWTEGDALALPFGRTPISTDERPKLASRCNVLGSIVGDAKALAGIKAGARIRVEKA